MEKYKKYINAKNIIIVSVISIIMILLFLPLLIDSLKMKKEFTLMYEDINLILKNQIETKDSDYSEYYDVKSLTYEVNKIYKTNITEEYGYEVTFDVNSDFEFSPYTKSRETEYFLITFSLGDLLDDFADKYNKMDHYKYTLKINGDEVYTKYNSSSIFSVYEEYIKEKYQEYKIELKESKIVWEYSDDKLQLKSMPTSLLIPLLIFLFITFTLIGCVIVSYYDKNASSKTKETFGTIGDLIGIFFIYVLISALTGGVGFIALPVLWLLRDRR